MGMMGYYLLAGLVAYLVGAIPTGLLVARYKGIDIRSVGSGNIGATNVYRAVGKGWGLATFAADSLKGMLPTLLLPVVVENLTGRTTPDALALFCAACAVIGHVCPVYLGFKGGKGIATSAGALVVVGPLSVLIALVVFGILLRTTRYVSVGSMGGSLALIVSVWILYGSGDMIRPIVLTALGLLGIWRHRSNIRRLLDGTESRTRDRPVKEE
tara:strand:+ start:1750 stop:2388 length:639 start_codon:yes stop_codon:yes gene_type:complete